MDTYKKHAVDYIIKAQKAGHTKEDITNKLKESGYPQSLINKAFEEASNPSAIQYDWKMISMFAAALFVVIIIIVLVSINFSSMDRERFIAKANKCQKAEYAEEIEGTTYLFATESCVFTKKVIAMAETEPEEVKDLFLNEEMTCYYNEGEFKTNWIEFLTKDLQYCKGDLKDIIEEILSFKT